MRSAVLLALAFLGCSKPLLRQEAQTYSQAAKEETRAVSGEARGSFEAMAADSVVIVRYDTLTREKTVVRYYGVEKTKTDTLTRTQTIERVRTDTVTIEAKVSEKGEPGLWDRIRLLLLGGLLATIISWLARMLAGRKS